MAKRKGGRAERTKPVTSRTDPMVKGAPVPSSKPISKPTY